MDEKLIVSVTDYIVTETVISEHAPVSEVDKLIVEAKLTGKVLFDVSRGGKQRYLLTQKSRLHESESRQIRERLGWSKKSS